MLVEHVFVTTMEMSEAMERTAELLESLGFRIDSVSGDSICAVRGRKNANTRKIFLLPQAVTVQFDRGRITIAASITPRGGKDLPVHTTFVTALVRAIEGLLVNQASVDHRFRYAHDLLSAALPGQLAALFSPQHGLWSEDQDNMIETAHRRHPRLEVPVYSLYAESRKPSAESLAGLDCLVVDLQDVGTRVYTYVWTLSYCLEACRERGIPVVVLDRPNPLGGVRVEGPRLQSPYTSFVGLAPIPMRHGLTIGEMARHLNSSLGIGATVEVTPMTGWRRQFAFADTHRPWVPPSPNLPRLEGVDLYPGMVLVEGTNLSEGRGTTTPFEVIGAPFIDPFRLADALSEWDLPGLAYRPLTFKPTFQKWQDRECGGVFLHVLDHREFRPYRAAVVLLASIRRLWPREFQWLSPPYEYETEKMPIDILSGGRDLREGLETGLTPSLLDELTALDEDQWWSEVDPICSTDDVGRLRT
ncbi:MAG: DUF1343 domain-containing protein [Planctomycetes bacterium]|nr:DUF1343 domain-containing protein [Planctomycetota bacterium]